MFRPRKFLFQIFLAQQNFCYNKIFSLQKIFRPQKFWPEKYVGLKTNFVLKIMLATRNVCPKIFLSNKKFWSQQNFGQKSIWYTNDIDPQKIVIQKYS